LVSDMLTFVESYEGAVFNPKIWPTVAPPVSLRGCLINWCLQSFPQRLWHLRSHRKGWCRKETEIHWAPQCAGHSARYFLWVSTFILHNTLHKSVSSWFWYRITEISRR
jgi:hypothetical protein